MSSRTHPRRRAQQHRLRIVVATATAAVAVTTAGYLTAASAADQAAQAADPAAAAQNADAAAAKAAAEAKIAAAKEKVAAAKAALQAKIAAAKAAAAAKKAAKQAAAAANQNAAAVQANCAQFELVEARGSTEAMPAGAALPQVATTIVGASGNQLTQFGLPYPATLNNYAQSESTGVTMLNQHLADVAAACPDTQFVLMGYSQGAQVVADSLGGSPTAGTAPIPADLGAKVAAVVLFGDPTHTPDAPYNLGTAPGATGIFQRDAATLAPYADRIVSYCDTGDPFCAQGNNLNVHLAYANVYGTDATDQVIAHIG